MSDMHDLKSQDSLEFFKEDPGDRAAEPRRRKHHPWRIALASLGSVLGLVVVLAVGSYAYVNHVVSSIPRVNVAHLVAAGSGSGQTFLVTSSQTGPTGGTKPGSSNIVMLIHINADGKHGGAVGIPDTTLVNVPGHGTHPLSYALVTGGPSLLVQTVSQFTGIAINHYARIDFTHVAGLVNAIGGVDVTIPKASRSFGYTFKAGVNHLTGVTAIYYSRDPSISDLARTLRQEVFVRAVLNKIADDHLVTNPVTMVRVLNSITSALTLDSNMTNSAVESLARQFGSLGSSAGTFVVAPTRTVNGQLVLNTAVASQLWTAIKHDSIAAFATAHPSAVTPASVP
jgi:LCP family protein required for cell wall assembly